MNKIEPKYLKLSKGDKDIYFRINNIKKYHKYSAHGVELYDYYVIINDMYVYDNKSIEERMVNAKNEAYKFWNSIADAGLKKHIKDNKNGYEKAINLIFSGYETSKSFAEIFEATSSEP